jgi:hypothetical protein
MFENVDNNQNSEQVEDIFEGVDTGQGVDDQKVEKKKTEIPEADPSSNKGLIKFLLFVTLAAVIILGGAYWLSEWLISSM